MVILCGYFVCCIHICLHVIRSYLLPDRSTKGKRKTHVIKNSLNPVWEERFGYEKVSLEELSRERVLEVTLWDLNKGASNEFIGGLRLGPAPGRAPKHKEWMDCIGDEVSHWEAMLSRPGEWVEQWHILRPSMDPRDIDLAILPGEISLGPARRPSWGDDEAPFGALVSPTPHSPLVSGQRQELSPVRESPEVTVSSTVFSFNPTDTSSPSSSGATARSLNNQPLSPTIIITQDDSEEEKSSDVGPVAVPLVSE